MSELAFLATVIIVFGSLVALVWITTRDTSEPFEFSPPEEDEGVHYPYYRANRPRRSRLVRN
jgi:hypothetical protein